MPITTPKVPDGLPELMRGLAKSVIKENPENLYVHAAEYFENLIRERDGDLDKGYKSFSAFKIYEDYNDKGGEKGGDSAHEAPGSGAGGIQSQTVSDGDDDDSGGSASATRARRRKRVKKQGSKELSKSLEKEEPPVSTEAFGGGEQRRGSAKGSPEQSLISIKEEGQVEEDVEQAVVKTQAHHEYQMPKERSISKMLSVDSEAAANAVSSVLQDTVMDSDEADRETGEAIESSNEAEPMVGLKHPINCEDLSSYPPDEDGNVPSHDVEDYGSSPSTAEVVGEVIGDAEVLVEGVPQMEAEEIVLPEESSETVNEQQAPVDEIDLSVDGTEINEEVENKDDEQAVVNGSADVKSESIKHTTEEQQDIGEAQTEGIDTVDEPGEHIIQPRIGEDEEPEVEEKAPEMPDVPNEEPGDEPEISQVEPLVEEPSEDSPVNVATNETEEMFVEDENVIKEKSKESSLDKSEVRVVESSQEADPPGQTENEAGEAAAAVANEATLSGNTSDDKLQASDKQAPELPEECGPEKSLSIEETEDVSPKDQKTSSSNKGSKTASVEDPVPVENVSVEELKSHGSAKEVASVEEKFSVENLPTEEATLVGSDEESKAVSVDESAPDAELNSEKEEADGDLNTPEVKEEDGTTVSNNAQAESEPVASGDQDTAEGASRPSEDVAEDSPEESVGKMPQEVVELEDDPKPAEDEAKTASDSSSKETKEVVAEDNSSNAEQALQEEGLLNEQSGEVEATGEAGVSDKDEEVEQVVEQSVDGAPELQSDEPKTNSADDEGDVSPTKVSSTDEHESLLGAVENVAVSHEEKESKSAEEAIKEAASVEEPPTEVVEQSDESSPKKVGSADEVDELKSSGSAKASKEPSLENTESELNASVEQSEGVSKDSSAKESGADGSADLENEASVEAGELSVSSRMGGDDEELEPEEERPETVDEDEKESSAGQNVSKDLTSYESEPTAPPLEVEGEADKEANIVSEEAKEDSPHGDSSQNDNSANSSNEVAEDSPKAECTEEEAKNDEKQEIVEEGVASRTQHSEEDEGSKEEVNEEPCIQRQVSPSASKLLSKNKSTELDEIKKVNLESFDKDSAEALFYSLKKTELESQESPLKDPQIKGADNDEEEHDDDADVVVTEEAPAPVSRQPTKRAFTDDFLEKGPITEEALKQAEGDGVVIDDGNAEVFNPMVAASNRNQQLQEQMHSRDDSVEFEAARRRASIRRSMTDRVDLARQDSNYVDLRKYDPDFVAEEDEFDGYYIGSIKNKILASSVSMADSDYYDPEKAEELIDENNIRTALETIGSTDTESTLPSQTTIQANRGFLKKSSQNTSSNIPYASFGNNAIDQSLDEFIEREEQNKEAAEQQAASKIQRSYRRFRSNKKKLLRDYHSTMQTFTEDQSTESLEEYPNSIIQIKLDQKRPEESDNSMEEARMENRRRPMYSLNIDEYDTAARRMTLTRGVAMQRNSTPEEDSSKSDNASGGKKPTGDATIRAATTEESPISSSDLSEDKKSSTSGDEKENKDNSSSKSSEMKAPEVKSRPLVDGRKYTSLDAQKLFIARQRTMPVQIDASIIRVLPKHLRKRNKSAGMVRK